MKSEFPKRGEAEGDLNAVMSREAQAVTDLPQAAQREGMETFKSETSFKLKIWSENDHA